MLKHIVLFKLKDTSADNLARVENILQGMRGKIPELKDFEVGFDINGSDYSYDVAFVAEFASLKDLEGYRAHPLHQEVSNAVKSASESYVKIDYEL
ncbi:MAG: Dabb family protein [Bacillota bacterium]|nr:Dabb family protein [Bacillota bacterium]MDW7682630.1 Dabb family protein [Bacillota bacterium]